MAQGKVAPEAGGSLVEEPVVLRQPLRHQGCMRVAPSLGAGVPQQPARGIFTSQGGSSPSALQVLVRGSAGFSLILHSYASSLTI